MLLAACGSGPSANTTPETTVPSTIEGPMLTIGTVGAFMPVAFAIDQYPHYTITRDGRLIYVGPVPEIFPGPLLPNILEVQLDADTLDEIQRLIDEIGFADFDEKTIEQEPGMMVADAGVTVFTYIDAEGEHVYNFDAMGVAESRGTDAILLLEIDDILSEAANGTGTPYVSDSLQVMAGEALAMSEPFETAPWPLEVPLEDMEPFQNDVRCVVLTGQAADDATAVFADATAGYRWGDAEVALIARPLLPGEDGCTVDQG